MVVCRCVPFPSKVVSVSDGKTSIAPLRDALGAPRRLNISESGEAFAVSTGSIDDVHWRSGGVVARRVLTSVHGVGAFVIVAVSGKNQINPRVKKIRKCTTGCQDRRRESYLLV